jgi:malyl-CoA/(S)-citramalyl-CoA lyase
LTEKPASSASDINSAARERSRIITERIESQIIDLEPKFLVQMAHLTTPATVWKYVEGAATKSAANLVMLDLEDSIPRDNEDLLRQGRANIIRAFNELDWGKRLRFFRPRGLDLDPGHEDITEVISEAGANIDGLIYPKVECADEVRSLDETLTALEAGLGLTPGRIRIEVLIESAAAEEDVFNIACSSRRLAGLIFGSYDYWASIGMRKATYRSDHPLLNSARCRIVKAARSVGIPAIAEMTTNYPTRDKTEDERREAIEEFKRDALLAREFGFAGKWTGIPDQTALAVEIFRIPDEEIARAISEARRFIEAESQGRGAAMIAGQMADRATDRINRVTLKAAYALGRLDDKLAKELGIAD